MQGQKYAHLVGDLRSQLWAVGEKVEVVVVMVVGVGWIPLVQQWAEEVDETEEVDLSVQGAAMPQARPVRRYCKTRPARASWWAVARVSPGEVAWLDSQRC